MGGSVSKERLRKAVISTAELSEARLAHLPSSDARLVPHTIQTAVGNCVDNQRPLENLTMVKLRKVLLERSCHISKHGCLYCVYNRRGLGTQSSEKHFNTLAVLYIAKIEFYNVPITCMPLCIVRIELKKGLLGSCWRHVSTHRIFLKIQFAHYLYNDLDTYACRRIDLHNCTLHAFTGLRNMYIHTNMYMYNENTLYVCYSRDAGGINMNISFGVC